MDAERQTHASVHTSTCTETPLH